MKAIVLGGTGLIGHCLLQQLSSDPFFEETVMINRRSSQQMPPKTRQEVFDFSAIKNHAAALKGDVVFCCLGSTMAKAGSKEAFYLVDHDYPLEFAKAALAQGASRFVLVSAMGADAGSLIYYNRVKGETERDIAALGYKSFDSVQPSLLLGERNEARAGEGLGKVLAKVFDFAIPKKYKGVQAEDVAAYMIELSKSGTTGNARHESDKLQGAYRLAGA